jgi:hypothetical protein
MDVIVAVEAHPEEVGLHIIPASASEDLVVGMDPGAALADFAGFIEVL